MLNANNLRIVREFYGCKQSDIARMIGVSQQYIAFIENGGRPLTESIGYKITQALGLTPDRLQAIIAADAEYRRMQAEIKPYVFKGQTLQTPI